MERTTKNCALIFIGALCVSGCMSIQERCNPLMEMSHTSHISQHFGANKTNYGWNVMSAGMVCRPENGLVVTLLDGYSPEELDGRHEVFQGRVTYEFRP
jgi:hypothetical protein